MPKVDKNSLYGVWNASVGRRQRIHDMVLAKAFDVPVPDGLAVNSTTNVNNPGLLKTAVVCAALLAAGSGGALLAGKSLNWFGGATPMESQEYEVRFWAEDGSEVDVSRQ